MDDRIKAAGEALNRTVKELNKCRSTYPKFRSFRLALLDALAGGHCSITEPPRRYRKLHEAWEKACAYQYARVTRLGALIP